jgi:hypothetical protein
MENKAISPSDDGAGKRAMRKTIARDEKGGVGREKPDENKVEEVDIVTEVEEEVVPGSLLV